MLVQALFNYFSCSAVAIATVTGGSNAALVTFLMIAAHMVSDNKECNTLHNVSLFELQTLTC